MTIPTEIQAKAREVLADLRQRNENGLRLAKSRTGRDKARAALRALDEVEAVLSAALHAQDQEARKSERERAAALIEACTETFARCEIENDWTGLLSTLSAAILETGEFERTD